MSRPHPDTTSGRWVYFIRAIGLGMVKIGTAKDMVARFQAINNASPVDLKVLAVMPGDRQVEQSLHRRFASSRRRLEWFAETPELMQFIETAAAEHGSAMSRPDTSTPTDVAERARKNAKFMGEHFRESLARAIKHEGWTRRGLALKAGVDERLVSIWLAGKSVPSSTSVINLMRVSDVMYSWALLMRWLVGRSADFGGCWRMALAAGYPTAEQLLEGQHGLLATVLKKDGGK